MEKRNVPEIRFKGFAGDWEERKLGEVADRIIRKNTNLESTLPLTISAQHGLIDQITYFNNRVASRDISNYYLLKTGEFAYNKSYSEGYPFGVVKRLDLYKKGVLSTLYIVFAPKEKTINSNFLVSYYDTDNWHKQILERAAEGARNHGLLNISADDFLDTKLNFPKNILEQTAIGNFFRSLDRLITLRQQKYDKLVTVKKSLLAKMFPKDGKAVPELRFAGFTGEWEERKLGEVADVIGGGTPSTIIEEFWGGDIDWYAPAEINEQIFISSSQKKITELGLQKSSAIVLPIGTVLFTSRAGIGKTAILAKEGATNQGFQSIVPHESKLNTYFIFSRAQELKRYAETVGAGSTFVEVSGKQMAVMPTFIPSLEEQTAIGNFFKSLDSLITLQGKELEKLKNIKKSLLDKMFV